jgi:hypothetical protein
MPNGKPAGVRCVQLTDDLRCAIFTDPKRPACCEGLKPSLEMCGESQAEALAYLDWLEEATKPGLSAIRNLEGMAQAEMSGNDKTVAQPGLLSFFGNLQNFMCV